MIKVQPQEMRETLNNMLFCLDDLEKNHGN